LRAHQPLTLFPVSTEVPCFRDGFLGFAAQARIGETIVMKLSPADFQVLQHAADIADAQRELIMLSNRVAAKRLARLRSHPLMLASTLAIVFLSLLTLTSLS
jgi:hypothetical protein